MRRELDVTITAEGRDKGKVFRLTEMPASQGEMWATRALMALSASGLNIPDNVAQAGMAGVASVVGTMGLKAFGGVPWPIMQELMGEMWGCVRIIPDPANRNVVRFMVEDDIEEVATRVYLRAEVFSLHTGFSYAEIKLKLTSALKRIREAVASSAASTSPEPLQP